MQTREGLTAWYTKENAKHAISKKKKTSKLRKKYISNIFINELIDVIKMNMTHNTNYPWHFHSTIAVMSTVL